jgi:phosphotransferase system enzyme I (PtsP)
MATRKPSPASAWTLERGLALSLLSGATDLQGFYDKVLERAQTHLGAEAAALYLRDLESGDLVLRAVSGLNRAAVEHVRLRPGEGLAGHTLQHPRGLVVADQRQHPAYQPIEALDVAQFAAYLAVPIGVTLETAGVLSLYRRAPGTFTPVMVRKIRALAHRLDVAFEFAAAVASFVQTRAPSRKARALPAMIRGRTVSAGYVSGIAHVWKRQGAADLLEHRRLIEGGVADPSLLDRALARTARQFDRYQEQLRARIPEAAALIFEAHAMMLQDDFFVDKMRRGIAQGSGVARAVAEVAAEYIRLFEASEHEYVREKARDIEDLALRLLDNLDETAEQTAPTNGDHIVIARDLLPSDIVRIAQGNVRGIVLASGGSTAHVSLLVRSLGIPMLIASSPDLLHVEDGTPLLLDAATGILFINPPAPVVATFEKRNRLAVRAAAESRHMRDHTATRDGHRIRLMANINLLAELDHALQLKAEGVGLYRTELPYLVRDSLPSEEDQQGIYTQLVQRMAGRPVTFRTLDAGGDKLLTYFDAVHEANPALGLRSMRLTLKYPEILDRQLRSILRAAQGHDDIRIMFPMIGSIDEWRAACRRLDACVAEVAAETGAPCRVKVGTMVELPAVVELADAFAAEAAFFSIGTNDFIQYMLAVDRTNENVTEYYCPHHPAVLRGLQRVTAAAVRRNVEVSVCGEMGHDPRFVPFFIGIGVRTLSVDPDFLPEVQRAVASYTLAQAQAYAAELLAQETIEDVRVRLRDPSDAA